MSTGLWIDADVELVSSSHRAKLVSTTDGIVVSTEDARTAWAFWRSARTLLDSAERARVPLSLAIRGRRVGRLDAGSGFRPKLHFISLLKALAGVEAAASSRARNVPRAAFLHERKTKERTMSNPTNDTRTWPELAIGLYEQLTGRGAEISYQFDELEVSVPSKVGEGADFAKWRLNGALRIRTADK